jgi:hypothetical protein
VIFFGICDGAVFFLIALGAFFLIVVNTAAGVASTPKLLVRAARMLGIRWYMILPRVVLPAAMPYIFTGLRLGIGRAWVLVIVAEMMAVKILPRLRDVGRFPINVSNGSTTKGVGIDGRYIKSRVNSISINDSLFQPIAFTPWSSMYWKYRRSSSFLRSTYSRSIY